MNQLNDKLLKDYLLGKCTAQQMEEIDAWIQQSDENARWLFRVEERLCMAPAVLITNHRCGKKIRAAHRA